MPLISGGQMNRIVRRGRLSSPRRINEVRARAASSIAAAPDALSLAPGF